LSTVLAVRTAPPAPAVHERPPPVTDEAQRRADLRRMKRFAVALLVGAAVVYLVTRSLEDDVGWLAPVRATAEAAMVGALADWFAVTALFRHPLGIPIPHTAIIPANKDRIGRTLGVFVQENFLAPALVVERLREAAPARRAGAWLADPANARRATETVAATVAGLPDVLDDDEVSTAVRHAIVERIRATPAAPLLARGLEVAIAEGHHRLLVDAVLNRADEYLDANRDVLYQRLHTESPWWLPGAIDERIFGKIFGSAQRLVAELASDPDHELRRDIDVGLVELVDRLRTDPVLAARVEARKEQLLDQPDVQAWAGSVWADVKAYLLRSARDPDSVLRTRFEAALVGAGTRLRDDPSLQATVDGWLVDAVAAIVSQYRENAADHIAATVERWDPVDTADRLELVVGRDLQFIRINGTVVGGLAGLLIYLVGTLL
jgi:uncharacterized membrane-anchored protein YjiN (DUF445 family)